MTDVAGNELIAFFPSPEHSRHDMSPLPASLVALWSGPSLLLVFDNARGQWELPGGMIEPGESPRTAAVRELCEETGQRTDDLAFAGHAKFRLGAERRIEYAAVFAGEVTRPTDEFVAGEEIGACRWWDGAGPLPGAVQPIDLALAHLSRHVLDGRGP